MKYAKNRDNIYMQACMRMNARLISSSSIICIVTWNFQTLHATYKLSYKYMYEYENYVQNHVYKIYSLYIHSKIKLCLITGKLEQWIGQEKKRDVTQSHDKSPYPNRKLKKKSVNIKTPQTTSITQRLRTNVGRSVGEARAIQLVWLKPITGSQPSH